MAAIAMSRSVLVVEDDPDTSEAMVRLLQVAGHEVGATPSVSAALVRLDEWQPSHVLLDLMLPDAGGIVVLRSVRRRQLPIRVALVTAAGPDSQTVKDALLWKPDTVFYKPVNFWAIEAWLQQED